MTRLKPVWKDSFDTYYDTVKLAITHRLHAHTF